MITGREKGAENAPQTVEAYAVLDNLIEGCQLIGPDWRYLYVNRSVARHGRRRRDELLGRTMMECYPGIESTPLFAALKKCMADRIPDRMENEFTFPDGTRGWFELRLEPAPEGVIILSMDCTERRNSEEQSRQSQKMEAVGRLAGGVAHDFNNLLTVILIHGERLLQALPEDGPARSAALQMKHAGERAALLTGQLLAFSRQQVLDPRILDLNAAVKNTGDMLRRLLGEDIELSLSLQEDLGTIRADPGQIEQILLNLAVNARDAMPQGGVLSFETRNVDLDATYVSYHLEARPGPHVMLAVSDTGAGMDKATQARIFEPFFTTKDSVTGTGLGLSTVFGIVKQSGGTIWVYSEPGQGSTFKIYLPRLDAPPAPDPEIDAPAVATSGQGTILVVEDEDVVRDITVSVLRELGYRVLEANGGAEALERCAGHDGRVDLLVSDVVMPGMPGPRVAAEVKTLHPDVRILFLSGYTDDTVLRHGIVSDDVAFLQKPFSVEMLARKVLDCLSR